MTDFDYSEYMLDVAKNSRLLLHSVSNPCFSKVTSLPGLEEYLAGIRENLGLQLVIVDNHTGRFNDSSNSDNLFDRQVYTFFIFRYVKPNDFADRNRALISAKTLLNQILSKFFNDRIYSLYGLQHLERSSINYDTIGPVGNHCHGLMVHFTIKEFPSIVFDYDEWLYKPPPIPK